MIRCKDLASLLSRLGQRDDFAEFGVRERVMRVSLEELAARQLMRMVIWGFRWERQPFRVDLRRLQRG